MDGSARYRVCVSRLGPARELTHLAQIELLRRAVLVSALPAVLDRRRKKPRPRLAFGPAIAKGYESLAEYFDLELASRVPAEKIVAALSAALEDGYAVVSARRIPKYFPSLDASINVVRYAIQGAFPDDGGESLARFLSRREIVIEKLKDGGARVERVDARPLIIEMVQDSTSALRLSMRFGPKRTVKPEALLRAWLLENGFGVQGHCAILRKELLSETARGELIAP